MAIKAIKQLHQIDNSVLNQSQKMKKNNIELSDDKIVGYLYNDIAELIEQSRNRVAITINQEVTLLYWHIGRTISTYLLKNKRADYGESIVATLSQQLTLKFGRGFTKSSLHRMMNFYKVFNKQQKIATLSQELSWSHFVELIVIDDYFKRAYYLELSRREGWSVRTLRQRIDSMLYERTLLSKNPTETIKKQLDVFESEGAITPDLVFRDPYVLDFLGLKDTYSESDLEAAILNQLQEFLVELGTDFAFIARQKRIIIDKEDHKIDLLFFHRGLRRLVVIDLLCCIQHNKSYVI